MLLFLLMLTVMLTVFKDSEVALLPELLSSNLIGFHSLLGPNHQVFYDYSDFYLDLFSITSFLSDSYSIGTIVKYEVLAETSFVNSYLFRGTQNAYPNAGCITGTPVVNRTSLSSCEVSQGGIWSLAIQRNVVDQFYKLRVWYEDPIAAVLVEGRAAPAQLRAVDDLAYFRYNVPAGASSTNPMVSNQIYFVLDNVVGGSVEIGLYYNTMNGRQCAALKTCSSIEGYVNYFFSFFVHRRYYFFCS